jgi:ribose transport system permease protein
MLAILFLLCLLFSILTLRDQHSSGLQAARQLLGQIKSLDSDSRFLIIAPRNEQDDLFVRSIGDGLTAKNLRASIVQGDPSEIRALLGALSDSGGNKPQILTTVSYAPMVSNIVAQFPELASAEIFTPPSYRWPTFLLPDNIRNVANQIAVIAIIAIGMTMVIITAGIDLSVGSLVALSAVVIAWMVGFMGGADATYLEMFLAGAIAVALCGITGAFSGIMITRFNIPPFIATLAIMQVAAGMAYIISRGKPIYQLPESFIVLGRGAEPLLKIPYAVILMIGLYLAANFLMSRTTLGRYIYAVGGNSEAARLAGIRVKSVLLFVYTLCGMLAGLGGVIMASQLKSGAPTYGLTYELYVIAAVVVGGTSLSGGEGRIFGTLIGAFIIAVIQNGMNLTNVETYSQKVVLGLVILAAVMLDRIKQRRMARA